MVVLTEVSTLSTRVLVKKADGMRMMLISQFIQKLKCKFTDGVKTMSCLKG